MNGKQIHGETILHHGDRIVLGINHFFRLNCPALNSTTSSPHNESSDLPSSITIDFSRAQEEVLLHGKSHVAPLNDQVLPEISSLGLEDENRSTSSILSSSTTASSNDESSSGIVLELAIQQFEKEYSSISSKRLETENPIPKSSSCNSQISFGSPSKLSHHTSNTSLIVSNKRLIDHFDERFHKGIKLLRQQLLRANSLVREANSLCKEMNISVRFRVTMQIPAHNLTLLRKVYIINKINLYLTRK